MRPLYVDLDGTLLKTDALHESLVELFWTKPWALPSLLWALTQGKALFKKKLASQMVPDVTHWPYHEPLLAYLIRETREGRKLHLASASSQEICEKVADHLGIFTSVLATSDQINLSGVAKAKAILSQDKDFAYAGNAAVDFYVWRQASEAIVVHDQKEFIDRVHRLVPVSASFGAKTLPLMERWLRMINPRIFLLSAPVLLFACLGNGSDATIFYLSYCGMSGAAIHLEQLYRLKEARMTGNNETLYSLGEASPLGGLLASAGLLTLLVLFAVLWWPGTKSLLLAGALYPLLRAQMANSRHFYGGWLATSFLAGALFAAL